MTQQTQQELLKELKDALGGTWDDVAARTEIAARALKSYRLPTSSKGHRSMDKFARKAVEAILTGIKQERK
jgi:hypothetical protein